MAYTRSDIPEALLESDGDQVMVTTDTSGNLIELSYSSAPELSYPAYAVNTTIDAHGLVRFEVMEYRLFPDPAEETDFTPDVEAGDSPELAELAAAVPAQEPAERADPFFEWAMHYVDLLQYQSEAHRNGLLICNFCLKSQNDVAQMVSARHGLAICEECIDLCEDALVEEEAHGKDQ